MVLPIVVCDAGRTCLGRNRAFAASVTAARQKSTKSNSHVLLGHGLCHVLVPSHVRGLGHKVLSRESHHMI